MGQFRHLDLFSGIGGFALAASWVWREQHEIHSFVEIEPFAQKILKKHWPDVPIHDDIKNVTVDINANLLYIDKKGGVIMGRKKIAKYDEAVLMYEKGLSIQDCAEFFGITRQAMHKILKRRGVSFRSQKRENKDNHFFRGGKSNGQKRANHLVEKAIKKGIIVPQPCENGCTTKPFSDGRREVQAHHDDYNKPLEVRWLCQKCHHEWHKENTPKELIEPANVGRIDILTGGFP